MILSCLALHRYVVFQTIKYGVFLLIWGGARPDVIRKARSARLLITTATSCVETPINIHG